MFLNATAKVNAVEDKSTEEPAKFRINSSYQSFNDRQKNLFDQLNVIEHNTKDLLSQNKEEPPDSIEDDRCSPTQTNVKHEPQGRMTQFQGKDSIFKKPPARLPKRPLNRRIPDFQMNPHKWTCYSLADVGNEDLSEHANTNAAMSFLNQIKSRTCDVDVEMDDGDRLQKIVFKKTARKAAEDVGEKSSKVVFRNSKVVMPEYVIGQKIQKERKRKEKKVGADHAKEIKLGHLNFYDENDDE